MLIETSEDLSGDLRLLNTSERVLRPKVKFFSWTSQKKEMSKEKKKNLKGNYFRPQANKRNFSFLC